MARSETHRGGPRRRVARAHPPPQLPLSRPRRPGGPGRRVRPPLRRAEGARGGASRAGERRLSDSARRGDALGPLPQGRARRADGLAREGDDGRGAAQVGRRRAQAAGLRRAGRLRDRAEDRRLGRLARVRKRRVHPRRHARRRSARRGRHAEPPHGALDPAHAPRRRACAARGAGRDLLPTLCLRPRERAGRGCRQEDRAEPPERRGRLPAAAGLPDHRRTAARDLGLRLGATRGHPGRDALGDARVAPRARLPHESVR